MSDVVQVKSYVVHNCSFFVIGVALGSIIIWSRFLSIRFFGYVSNLIVSKLIYYIFNIPQYLLKLCKH